MIFDGTRLVLLPNPRLSDALYRRRQKSPESKRNKARETKSAVTLPTIRSDRRFLVLTPAWVVDQWPRSVVYAIYEHAVIVHPVEWVIPSSRRGGEINTTQHTTPSPPHTRDRDRYSQVT